MSISTVAGAVDGPLLIVQPVAMKRASPELAV
jgi:hypothetical protein